jgi:hypothetical protein
MITLTVITSSGFYCIVKLGYNDLGCQRTLGYKDLGCQRTLGYNEQNFSANWSFYYTN